MWQSDAELVGTLHRKRKPYMAMLIARCVDRGLEDSSARTSGQFDPHVDLRCSLRAFVDVSGIARNTVRKYLRTWDAMAAAGLAAPREAMKPGEDVEVPDMKTWTYYYREGRPPVPKARAEVLVPENRRIDQFARRLEASRRSISGRVSGPAGAAYDRAVICLQGLMVQEDSARNTLHLLDALTELGTALLD